MTLLFATLHNIYRLGEGCSHSAAILFKVECAVRNGYTSSKSNPCAWNQMFSTKVRFVVAVVVRQFCHYLPFCDRLNHLGSLILIFKTKQSEKDEISNIKKEKSSSPTSLKKKIVFSRGSSYCLLWLQF